MRRASPAASTICRYTSIDAPWGEVFVAAGPRGLLRIALTSFEDAFLAGLRRDFGPQVHRDDSGLRAARRALQAYLGGRTKRLDLETDLSGLRPFQRRVLEALRRVPFGRLVSYGELAARAGKPGAARAVGQAMGANPLPILYPCHRVVASDGTLGGFGGGLDVKRALLELEGVDVPPERKPHGAKRISPHRPSRAKPAAGRAPAAARPAARGAPKPAGKRTPSRHR